MKINNYYILKKLASLFALDNSGSMNGDKILQVDTSMSTIQKVIKEKTNELNVHPVCQIITFSTEATPLFDSPVDIADLKLDPLTAYGRTNVGNLCAAMDKELSSARMFRTDDGDDSPGFVAPVIFILSDGHSTQNYEEQKRMLETNKWYNAATRIVIPIGDDADIDMLKSFASSDDAVIPVNNVEDIAELLTDATISTIFMKEKTHISSAKISSDVAHKVKEEMTENEEPVDADGSTETPDPDDNSGKWEYDDSGWINP